MNEILPHQLWLGHTGEARNFRGLFAAGIRALVELAVEEAPAQAPRELILCRFPLVDGAGNDADLLALATNTLVGLLERRIPTLVSCSMGLSRGPALAAAALARMHHEPPEKWLAFVAERHPSDVSTSLWAELVSFLASSELGAT
jgi:protein-tyrosine phosphatase